MVSHESHTLVYEGVVGLCPCCLGSTEIRLGSTGGTLTEETWVIPEVLLYAIYSEIAGRIRAKVEYGKTVYYVLDPSGYSATSRNKLFFVGGDGTELAGPFGLDGLKVFLKTRLDGDRERVYVVNTTSRALSMIRHSPYSMGAIEIQEPSKVSDLF
jgi:hypothetical protein